MRQAREGRAPIELSMPRQWGPRLLSNKKVSIRVSMATFFRKIPARNPGRIVIIPLFLG